MPHDVTSRLDGPEFVFERTLRAAPSAIWEAWTDASKLARWFGPVGFSTVECVMEARPGGAWRVVIAGEDGVPYPLGGEVLEAHAPERLVLTMSTEGYPSEFYDAFTALGGVSTPLTATLTVALAEQDGGTRLTITYVFPTAADARANQGIGGGHGLAEMTTRLELLARILAPDDRTLVLTRRLAAPPERVFAAFSDARALDVWFGPDGFTTRTSAFAFEVGGEWRFEMVHEEHGVFPNRVRWSSIVPVERIDYLHDDGDGGGAFETTVWLEPEGAGTVLHLIQRHPTAARRTEVEGFGAVTLGGQTLGKLAKYLDS